MRKIKKSLICLAILLLFPMLHTKAEHVHSWSDWTVITEVSCGSKGYESRYCTSCFTEEEKVVPATGEHDWNEWLVYKSPSCFETGAKSRYCNNCSAREQEEIPAYGAHTWGDWNTTIEVTCTRNGYESRYCTKCFYKEERIIPSTGKHVWDDVWFQIIVPGCLKPGVMERYCKYCRLPDKRETPAAGHKWNAWRTTRKATAFKKGTAQRKCYICGYVESKTLPLLKTAAIKTTAEKQVKKALDNFFLAARNYNSAKMKKYFWSSSKVWTFPDKGTSSLWKKYTKTYLKFAVKSISVKRNKATVKVYCQYLDGTSAFYKALNKTSNYYLKHMNESDNNFDQLFAKYRQQYLKSEARTINNTTFTLYLTKKGSSWKINSFTSTLDNVINGNYTKFANDVW